MTIVAMSRGMGSGGYEIGAALATDLGTQNSNVEVTAQAGHVVLTGVVSSPAMMGAAAEVAQRVAGVTNVSCEAVEIPRVFPGPIM